MVARRRRQRVGPGGRLLRLEVRVDGDWRVRWRPRSLLRHGPDRPPADFGLMCLDGARLQDTTKSTSVGTGPRYYIYTDAGATRADAAAFAGGPTAGLRFSSLLRWWGRRRMESRVYVQDVNPVARRFYVRGTRWKSGPKYLCPHLFSPSRPKTRSFLSRRKHGLNHGHRRRRYLHHNQRVTYSLHSERPFDTSSAHVHRDCNLLALIS